MTTPSDTPVYRTALKNLKNAIAELDATRAGQRGRPTRRYVQLMNAVATAVLCKMNDTVQDAFLRAVKTRNMGRQFHRAAQRVAAIA